MEDYIVRATAKEGTIRALAAITTNMVKEAQKVHGLSPLATVALGRTMTAAAMMSTTLKEEKCSHNAANQGGWADRRNCRSG